MNFEASRAKAIDKLNQFVEKNLSDYSKLRNFDFGPDKRDNVSCLSPYVTHGVLNEIEIIKKSLEKFSFSKNEKFIQEVLWRTYWKGWLELRPNVWSDYLIDLRNIKEKYKDDKNYQNAIEGKTNIDCFNEWVNELKNNNYLHNHTRMWFASIWIFTLDLPWQLGAEFFMQHLFDGDAASNTLGWRWVAGVQTQGKHYLASEWNIKKFTNNRFKNIKLNENAPPKISERTYTIIKQDFKNSENIEPINLLIFDNNLSFEFTDFKNNKFKKIPNKLEIIFVEGNSNDNTYKILQELKEDFSDFFKISLLKQTSKGKKNAVVEGFNISSGETLAIIDSDFTVDIDDSIAAIMESTKNKNILINCARTTFPMEKDAMRWANYIGNRLFAIFLSILINKPVSDSLCGTKVFSRKFFKLMKQNGSWDSKSDPFGDFTIIFEAANNNIKILNNPVRYYARKSGAPNISRWIDGLKLLKVCWIYMISDI